MQLQPRMGRKLAALLLLVAAAMGPAAAARAGERSGDPAAGDSCRQLPPGKRLKLNLKPKTDLVDLVSWISAITCKQFIVPGSIPPQSRTVTIVAPRTITVAEAYNLFLAALNSVALTVYSSHGVLHVVETAKIKFMPIPVQIDDQD